MSSAIFISSEWVNNLNSITLLELGNLNSRIKFYTINSFAIKFLSTKKNISFLNNLENYFNLNENFFHNIYLNNIIKLSTFDYDFVGTSLNSDKFIKTLKKGVYNEEGKFLPWIMRIAHNLVIDFFRKNKRFPTFDKNQNYDIFQLIRDDNPSIERHLIDKQILNDLQKIVVKLPEDQKEVLNMRLYKEMSFKEISEVTGVSINTALGRMRYAIINLRKLIVENNITLSA